MDDAEFLSHLSDLIEDIDKMHQHISCLWFSHYENQIGQSFNLKSNKVADILKNELLRETIMKYNQFLNDNSLSGLFESLNIPGFEICSRVKTPNSIDYKIQKYQESSHGFGHVSINKCLNDLYGVRVIADTTCSFDKIQSFVNDKYGHLKCIDSSKPAQDPAHPEIKYIATHIYYRGNPSNNMCFPWELQIWYEKDAKNNDISHSKYKQDYTIWESDQFEEK